jgi:hypothetical protein
MSIPNKNKLLSLLYAVIPKKERKKERKKDVNYMIRKLKDEIKVICKKII